MGGIVLVTRITGFRGMRAGLSTSIYVDAQEVQVHKKSYKDNAADPVSVFFLFLFWWNVEVYFPGVFRRKTRKSTLL